MFVSGADVPTIHSRELLQRPGPVPDSRLANIVARAMPLIPRSPSPATDSSDPQQSCADNETTGRCERMIAASPNITTIPIVLGVVVPLLFAFVVLVFLHRRHLKKLKREDAEDKTKSLDFGMDGAAIMEKNNKKNKKGKKGKKFPEMSAADARNSVRQDRGLSMDLTMANPYLLPPELQQSRESLHSLSRSVINGDDKYRATTFIPDDGSLRSPSSLHQHDSASIYTFSSRQRTMTETDSTKGLISNIPGHIGATVPTIQVPIPAAKANNHSLLAPTTQDNTRESYLSTTSSNGHITAMRASNNYLGQYISGGTKNKPVEEEKPEEIVAELESQPTLNEPHQLRAIETLGNVQEKEDASLAAANFDFGIPPNTYELASSHEPTLPQLDIPRSDNILSEIYEAPGHEVTNEATHPVVPSEHNVLQEQQVNTLPNPRKLPDINVIADYENESDYYDEEADDTYDINEYRDTLGYDPRRLTMGMRPLPPDDPNENPEERATRIRSFYKEYFEDSAKPGGDKARQSYFDGSEGYIDDYYGSHHQPSYGYGSNGHGSYGYAPQPYGSRGPSAMSMRGPMGRHRATVSNGSYMSGGPGPRAYSSASQRLPGQRMRGPPPKRHLPPPAPLPVLPSPSMLKEDSMLPNAVDFAPPQVFKNQRSGTPDSLKGGLRPFSPSARAYNPLVSSFDDLSALPSPHMLRKSGTFTSLDFAPPRFAAAPPSGSDAGSIRSHKSGMSAMQLNNIRSGAYRLSRIPKEVAGTRDELANALKPQWNAR